MESASSPENDYLRSREALIDRVRFVYDSLLDVSHTISLENARRSSGQNLVVIPLDDSTAVHINKTDSYFVNAESIAYAHDPPEATTVYELTKFNVRPDKTKTSTTYHMYMSKKRLITWRLDNVNCGLLRQRRNPEQWSLLETLVSQLEEQVE